ncbi:PatB family C-S lyase [Oceaniserpentilla sp. 4NH20-0058]|uniref:MalY/PatB family protein n=1 Tax=Oceaniserpentilla sp. 4NH20-0058 TaxID=3127660 RepID=UPI0031070622
MEPFFLHNVDRSESESIKWKRYKNKDVIPLWVADMDFHVAPQIVDAIKNRANHGVFGYGSDSPVLRELIIKHCQTHYSWAIKPEWIVFTPGVVKGLNLARAISANHGKPAGITALPVYPHLMHSAPILSFKDQTFNTIKQGDSWSLDLEGMKASITDETGVVLLCNPHNPIGKVYNREELQALADVCIEHDLIICSDDIHCDLILNGKQHIPIASLSEEVAKRSITLMAPSKTFNIPGLDMAFAIISDSDLRKQYAQLMDGLVGHVNIIGMHAAEAAFKHGEPWRLELIEYLKGNAVLIESTVNGLALIAMQPIEATYLAWIDVSQLNLENPYAYFESFGLGFSDGKDFGDNQYVRLNFGCQRPLLVEALARFEKAINARLKELAKG